MGNAGWVSLCLAWSLDFWKLSLTVFQRSKGRLPSFREELPLFGEASRTSPAPALPGPRSHTLPLLQSRPGQPHQALPAKEVGDHVSIQVVDKASGVIAAAVDEELLPGVLIDEGADLKWGRWSKMKSCFLLRCKLRTTELSTLKGTIQWLLVHSECHAPVTSI